ncbi:hypothetical protein Hte_009627 [Hypoxylon texense]
MSSAAHVVERGRELATKLRESWPHRLARSPAEHCVCSAASILRWLTIIFEETRDVDATPISIPQNGLISLAFADFPYYSDSETESEISAIVAECAVSLGREVENVFDIMESPLMAEMIWSRDQHLLFKPSVVQSDNESCRRYNLPVARVVEDSLIHIDDPRMLAAVVNGKLSWTYSSERRTSQLYVATPPETIRVLWRNSSPDTWNRDTAIFDALQAFEMSYQDLGRIDKTGNATFVGASTSYRLICVVKVPEPGEDAVAEHLYECDGTRFVPSFGGNRIQHWSYQEPGRYYMLYCRSDQARHHRGGVPTQHTRLSADTQEVTRRREILLSFINKVECKSPQALGQSPQALGPGSMLPSALSPLGTSPQQPSALGLPGSSPQQPSALSLPGSSLQQPSALGSLGPATQQPSALSLPGSPPQQPSALGSLGPAKQPSAPNHSSVPPLQPLAHDRASASPMPLVPSSLNIPPVQPLQPSNLNASLRQPLAYGRTSASPMPLAPGTLNIPPTQPSYPRGMSNKAGSTQPPQSDRIVFGAKRPYDGPHDGRQMRRNGERFPNSNAIGTTQPSYPSSDRGEVAPVVYTFQGPASHSRGGPFPSTASASYEAVSGGSTTRGVVEGDDEAHQDQVERRRRGKRAGKRAKRGNLRETSNHVREIDRYVPSRDGPARRDR